MKPNALDIITEAIPVDPGDGLAVVAYDTRMVWDLPEVLAIRIHAALEEAGYLTGAVQ